MKQILFLTDMSEASLAAFRYAQRMALHLDASITLAHIFESPTPLLQSNFHDIKRLEKFTEDRWESIISRLKTFAAKLSAKQFADIPLDFIATDGDVVTEVLVIQEQNNFDFVVLRNSEKELSNQLFGNISTALIDQLKCPILFIPPDTKYVNIDRILYCTAFQMGDKRFIEWLLDWSIAFDAQLDLLHVYTGVPSIAEQKMKEILLDFEQEKELGVITNHLKEGKILEALEQHYELYSPQIIAIQKRKQGFWQRLTEKSLSKQLLYIAKSPLLILK